MPEKRIGLMFGFFNPVCIEDIQIAKSFLFSSGLDKILLIPLSSGRTNILSLEDRYKMITAACAGNKQIFPFQLNSAGSDSSLSEEDLCILQKSFPKSVFISVPSSDSNENPLTHSEAFSPVIQEYCRVKGLYGFHSRMERESIWIDQLFNALKPHRFAHSLSVAYTSVYLAALFNLDTHQAESAGLLHDCAKCLPLAEMQEIALENNLTDDPVIFSSGSLLHSLVGAQLAKDCYGMKDPDILEAIRYHNTGYPGMSRLARCVCLADFIEPNREPFPRLEEVRRLADSSLEKALLLSLELTAAYVSSSGKKLHPRTTSTIEWLKSLPDVRTV